MKQGARAAALAAAMVVAAGGPAFAADRCGFDIDDETLAEGAPPELMIGRDDRRELNSALFPWRAIGTLLTPEGSCTGTVVGRDLVLTAAHCVTEYVQGRIEPSDVIFLAGYRDGQAFATAQATRIVPATNRPLSPDDPSAHVSDDWALVELDQPIGLETGIVPVAELTGNELDLAVHYGTSVTQAGYSGDMPERLTGHQGCRLLGTEPGNWVLHDCDIVPGDSGSPLLIERGGQLQVFAVATAMLCSGNGQRAANSAVDARAWGPMYRRMTESSGGVAVRIATPDGQSNREEAPSGNGPRIVRIPCEGC